MATRFLSRLDRAATMMLLFLVVTALLWVTLPGRPLAWPSLAAPAAATIALWFVWLLGRELATASVAAAGVVLASLAVHLAAWASAQHQDGVELWALCAAAAATWLFYAAIRYQNRSSWIWLGLVVAMAIPAGPTIVIHLGAFLAFMLRHRSFRDRRNSKGVILAALSFTLAAVPLLWWTAGLDSPPWNGTDVGLSKDKQGLSAAGILSFLSVPFIQLLPAIVAWLLCTAGQYWPSRPATGAAYAYDDEAGGGKWWLRLTYWDRSFLLWMGLFPGLVILVLYFLPWKLLITPWPPSHLLLTAFLLLWGVRGVERIVLARLVVLAILLHAAVAYYSINETVLRILSTYH